MDFTAHLVAINAFPKGSTASRDEDVFTIDGIAYDLSDINDEDIATPRGIHPFIGDITRVDGILRGALIWGYDLDLGEDEYVDEHPDFAPGNRGPYIRDGQSGAPSEDFTLDIRRAPDLRAQGLSLGRVQAKAAMTAWINALTGAIQNQYPDVVQKGWTEEEAMALAFRSSTETPAQLATLTADGLARGRTPEQHANRILEKAHMFHNVAAQTRRLWLATDSALDAVTDPRGFDAVLSGAIEQATPLAKAYGLL